MPIPIPHLEFTAINQPLWIGEYNGRRVFIRASWDDQKEEGFSEESARNILALILPLHEEILDQKGVAYLFQEKPCEFHFCICRVGHQIQIFPVAEGTQVIPH